MTHVSQPPSLDLKSLDLGLRFPNRGIFVTFGFSGIPRNAIVLFI